MQKHFLFLIIVITTLLQLPLSAQNYLTEPYSFTHKLKKKVTAIQSPLPKGTMRNVSTEVRYDLDNAGQWDILRNGDRVWRFRICAENATGMGFFLADCHIPEGAYLFAYNQQKKWVVGPIIKPNYAAFRPNELNNMRIGDVLGNDITIEYYEPAQHKGKSKLEIRGISRRVDDFPYSMTHQLKTKPDTKISPITIDTFLNYEKKVKPYMQYPEIRLLGWSPNFTPYNSGTWEELPNGDRVWRLVITAPSLEYRIQHIDLYFTMPFLPPGSRLYYYSPDKTHVSPNLQGSYNNGYAPGNTIIIEYYEPKAYKNKSNFKIESIGHNFLISQAIEKSLYCASSGGENCTPEVRCSCEYGNDGACIPDPILCSSIITQSFIDTIRRATVRIKLIASNGQDYSNCTGTLINNALNEPIVLTANHCFRGDGGIWHYAVGDSVKWRFYFNDESKRDSITGLCSDALSNRDSSNFIGNGYVLAASGVAGSTSARSDFALIKLTKHPDKTAYYTPYYAGWNAQKNLGDVSAGFGIHHPGGTSKKVSIEDSALNLGCDENNGLKPYQFPVNSWQYFQKDITTNNDGDHLAVTFERGVNRPGSSGHAFLDQNGLIRGQFRGSSVQLCCATTDQDAFQHEEHMTPNTGGNANYLDENCNAVVGTSPNKKYLNGNTERYSEYGRLWYSWAKGAYNVDNMGGISSDDTLKSTLKYWLDPYSTEPDTVMAGLSPSNCDLYLKDCTADIGTEPSACTSPIVGTSIVASPDLWNNRVNIFNSLDTIGNTHEMPDFMDSEGNHLDNYLSFNVRNPNSCTSAPATLHLYWAMASTGLNWSNSWQNHDVGIGSNTCIVGNEIGVDCYANEIHPYQVPALNPGQTYSDDICWLPPNFTDPNADSLYYPYQNPNLCDNLQAQGSISTLQPRFAISLLARLVSLDNPISNEQQGSIMPNVRNNNNITLRNTFLADIGAPPQIIWVTGTGNINVVLGGIRGLIGGDPEELQGLLNVELLPGAELWDKWASTGFKGEGIEIISDGIVKITNLDIAKLLDIPFEEGAEEPLAVRVTVINSSGKSPNYTQIPNKYDFAIWHEPTNPTGYEPESSPCLFEVNDILQYLAPQTPTDFAHIKLQPNPFNTATQIVFELYQNSYINLQIYDLQGRLVQSIYKNQYFEQGTYTYTLSEPNFANGIYNVVLQTQKGAKTQKLVKLM